MSHVIMNSTYAASFRERMKSTPEVRLYRHESRRHVKWAELRSGTPDKHISGTVDLIHGLLSSILSVNFNISTVKTWTVWHCVDLNMVLSEPNLISELWKNTTLRCWRMKSYTSALPMVLSPCWEANSSSAVRGILCLLSNQKFH
jgi:hypothetical protein